MNRLFTPLCGTGCRFSRNAGAKVRGVVCALTSIAIASVAMASPVLLEAESFKDKGGWVVDQQFMDVMGSPYLLAHGLGNPVRDAVTSLACNPGRYRLWVRTRDWVSPCGPGRFTVSFDGDVCNVVFGKYSDSKWDWRDGGWIDIKKSPTEVRLHDVTGFEGRCDAMLLIPEAEATETMPNNEVSFSWRRQLLGLPEQPKKENGHDFVVVGGGYAGMCAAVSAARQGVKTVLIQDRPVFGGNASSEVRVGPIGRLGLPPYPRNSDLSYELIQVTKAKGTTSGGLRPMPNDRRVFAWLKSEPNLTVYANTRVVFAEVNALGRICAVTGRNIETGEETRFKGRFFADCTGDANVAVLTGAHIRSQPETRNETGESLAPDGQEKGGGYGSTCFWLTRWTKDPHVFPSCPWALPIHDEGGYATPPKSTVIGDYPYAACWNWEIGIHDDVFAHGEEIRDYAFRAAYGMWDYLKNQSTNAQKYATAELSWMGYILGKRAARRIIGDYILTEQDLTQHHVYADGCVTTTWYLDLHFPHPVNSQVFPRKEFRSLAYDDPNFKQLGKSLAGEYTEIQPYPIPFRCFYSTNVPNLFMAGKDISVTHVALASVRVEHTTGTMGTMIGRAASLCVKNNWMPRELGATNFKALDELLKNPGARSALSIQGQRVYENRETFWKNFRYHFIRFGVWVKGRFRAFFRLFG